MHGMMKGDKDKRKSWSVKTEKDGICTSIEVREVSNGFIICKTNPLLYLIFVILLYVK